MGVLLRIVKLFFGNKCSDTNISIDMCLFMMPAVCFISLSHLNLSIFFRFILLLFKTGLDA